MLQIHNQATCPKWIRKNCENGQEKNGIRYTCYFSDPKSSNTTEGRKVLFYIAYSEIDLQTMLSVVQRLEFEKKHIPWSSRFGTYNPVTIKKTWKNKFLPIRWVYVVFICILFSFIIFKSAFELVKIILVYLQ